MGRRITLADYVAVLVLITILIAVTVPLSGARQRGAAKAACASNLSTIGKAIAIYADVPANGGYFPTMGNKSDPFANEHSLYALSMLYRGYIQDPKVFSCPANPIKPRGNSNNHGSNAGQNVLLGSGTVVFRTDAVNPIKSPVPVDPDIYALNPELSRKDDSYIRQ